MNCVAHNFQAFRHCPSPATRCYSARPVFQRFSQTLTSNGGSFLSKPGLIDFKVQAAFALQRPPPPTFPANSPSLRGRQRRTARSLDGPCAHAYANGSCSYRGFQCGIKPQKLLHASAAVQRLSQCAYRTRYDRIGMGFVWRPCAGGALCVRARVRFVAASALFCRK